MNLPPVTWDNPRTLGWFRNWQLLKDDPDRVPFPNDFPEAVLTHHQRLRERLIGLGDYSRVIAFAYDKNPPVDTQTHGGRFTKPSKRMVAGIGRLPRGEAPLKRATAATV